VGRAGRRDREAGRTHPAPAPPPSQTWRTTCTSSSPSRTRARAAYDNRRFAWDGISIRHIANEDEFVQLYQPNRPEYRLFELHPKWNTLAVPYLLTIEQIRGYVGGEKISL
jgi:hypothetical protein